MLGSVEPALWHLSHTHTHQSPPRPAHRADLVPDSFSRRLRELRSCAELALHLSLALGAQPHFATPSQRCSEPTLPRPRGKRQNCDIVVAKVYLRQKAQEVCVHLSLSGRCRYVNGSSQNDLREPRWDPNDCTVGFSTDHKTVRNPPVVSFLPPSF